MNLAIKLPFELDKKVLAFPFLQALIKEIKSQIEKDNQELPEEEWDALNVHLLSEKENIEVLFLLPFKAFYHQLEREDLKTVFTAHRAAKNLRLDHVDVYVCLTESFVDASLGKSLGAKKRVGFATGKNGFFLNHKVSLLKGRHYCEQYYELIKAFNPEPPEDIKRGFSRELKPYYADWRENPYFVINLSLEDGEVGDYWRELFELCENANFVFICDEMELEEQKPFIDGYIQTLPHKNTYKVFPLSNNIEFARMVSYAQTFVCHDSPLVHVAAYSGAHIHFLHKNFKLDQEGLTYFLGDVRYFNLNEPFYQEDGGAAYHKIFDELIKFIDSKTKEDET